MNRYASHGLMLCVGAILAWTVSPIWREIVIAWNQDDYGLLVEQCDGAMRDHFQAKRAIDLGDDAEATLAASEIGLIVCQDYDIYQKRLMRWGLEEEDLSHMRLQAIEARSTDLREVVDTHEIRF